MRARSRIDRWRWLTGLLLLLFAMPAAMAAVRVQVLDAPAAALSALRSGSPDIQWLAESSREPADLLLAWQPSAYAQARVRAGDTPVLVLAQHPGQLSLRSQDAALYWAPALEQQIQLARQIRPGLTRIGILHRAGHTADLDALPALPGVNLVTRAVNGPLQARDIAELAQRADLLVAVNDEQLFSGDNAKLVLLTAYRHQRAWVGPTPAYVHAGAIATMAVSKGELVAALIERVRHWQRHRRLGASQVLTADQVICNSQVARSLGLGLVTMPGCSGENE